MSNELKRVLSPEASDQRPEGWFLTPVEAVFENNRKAIEAEKKIRSLMRIIIEQNQKDIARDELRDEDWDKVLPHWFRTTFHDYTNEELERCLKDKSSLGWHYGSWLDSIKERVWQWWDYRVEDNKLFFTLLVDGWPYSISAFVHMVKAAGAKEVIDVDQGFKW